MNKKDVALYVAIKSLQHIRDIDYRGNRSTESTMAEEALKEIEKIRVDPTYPFFNDQKD